MSELIKKNDNSATIRWKLLTGASALALISWANQAVAADGRSQLWIELGGQLERTDQSQQIFAPLFVHSLVADGIIPVDVSQKPPLYSSGFEGALEFDPADSNWQFTASIRYGRSNSSRTSHDQTNNPPLRPFFISVPAFGIHITSHSPGVSAEPVSRKFGDTTGRNREQHVVLDFQAGRDVGLGLFGGKSTVDAGVRFAQFSSRSSAVLTANAGPNWQPFKYATSFYGYPAHIYVPMEGWDLYHARANISRSFKGVGPSLAFKASVPFAGNPQNGELGLDLGINGAVLFGRQNTKAHHETLHQRPYLPHLYNFIPLQNISEHNYNTDRSRTVTVPNVGGFAAVSFNYVNAKISLGYRADFFFNAIDGGIDTRKNENRGFFGPYASISVGLGD